MEGHRPPQRGEISYFSMQLMMECISFEPFSNFMEIYGPSMQFEIPMMITMNCTCLPKNNRHLTVDSFEDVEEPDLADDDPHSSYTF